MTVPRIYFPESVGEGGLCILGKQNLRYIKTVLRMTKGDRLILFDGTGWEYEAIIRQFSTDGITVEISKKEKIPDKDVKITLFQALPKANKMDFITQKATELGVDKIVSFQSARSIPRLSAEKARLKVSRWHSIAKEASRQCGRADVPEVTGIFSLDEMLSYSKKESMKIIFWEEESKRSARQVLHDEKYKVIKDISVVIGPEGGFEKEEVDSIADKGFIPVRLGKNILKVDTAVLTILSIIQYEKGIFRGAHSEEVF